MKIQIDLHGHFHGVFPKPKVAQKHEGILNGFNGAILGSLLTFMSYVWKHIIVQNVCIILLLIQYRHFNLVL